jgi:Tfp pilus assembly protein PilN
MMLVEINLLPQKEPKKFNIIYLSAIVAVLILIGGVYFWQINSVKSDVASVDQRIAATNKITETTEKNATHNETTNSPSLLKAAVEWADDYPIQTVPVMRHLTALLPERGFIQSFAYTEAGIVTISVQFDSSREAAYFLESLKDSDWIEDVSLTSLTANETEEAANTATQSTGQTTAAATTGTAAGTTTNTAASAQAATNGQSAATAGQTAQTNTTSTTTTNSNTTNTGDVSNGTTTTKPANNNIVPRYVGQFEIKFNKDVIKKANDKSKTGEGVTAS